MTTPPSELPIGRIAGLFGIRGELKCDPTNAGRTLFSPGASFRCSNENASIEVRLAGVREHKGRLLVRLDGVDDATAAQRYVGATFFAPRDAIHLERGEYFDADLVGCEVFGADERRYGRVERVEHYPASDMLLVDGRMLPMVRAFIRSIDVVKKRISVEIPAGLLDD